MLSFTRAIVPLLRFSLISRKSSLANNINLFETQEAASGLAVCFFGIKTQLCRGLAEGQHSRVDSRGFRHSFINETDLNSCERPASHHSPLIVPSARSRLRGILWYFLRTKRSKLAEVILRMLSRRERAYCEIRSRLSTNNATRTRLFSVFSNLIGLLTSYPVRDENFHDDQQVTESSNCASVIVAMYETRSAVFFLKE